MAKNAHLNQAKKEKNDEFYTQYADIEKELINYDKKYFKDKTVYLPCDDLWSNFWKYFTDYFREYGLKKLIASHYEKGAETVITHSYDGVKVSETEINGDGDFRSEAVTPLWQEADLIITNPPFSLFREFIKNVMDYKKEFIVLGHQNAVTYNGIFPYIKENMIKFGYSIHSAELYFLVPSDNQILNCKRVRNEGNRKLLGLTGIRWFTNLPGKTNQELHLIGNEYVPEKYPYIDGTEIINVNKTPEIPVGYCKEMAVPVTYLDKHNPDDFDITGYIQTPFVQGKPIYKRLVIKRKERL